MALFPTRILAIRNMIIPRPGFIVLSSGSISSRLRRYQQRRTRNRTKNIN